MRALVLAVSMMVVVAACGGDDDSPKGGGESPVVIDANEFEFKGDDPVRVTAGAEVVLELRNRGSIEHNWTLLAAGVGAAGSEEITAADIVAQVAADASKAGTVQFVAPSPGTYRVVCTIPGHLEAGMEASLVAS